MSRMLSVVAAGLLLVPTALRAGSFEILGVPVRTPMLMGAIVGQDEKGNEVLYFNCAQPGKRLFLLQVNPKTDRVRQFGAPVGDGAWTMITGPDKCLYIGTWESGYLLRFDPKDPDKGLQSLGKPSQSESYIWELAVGQDGRLYGCTYPNAKLVRFDPQSGKSEDLGRLDPKEMYARRIAASTNGSLYIGIGTVNAQVVRFEVATGRSHPMFSETNRPHGTALVFQCVDGRVCAQVGERFYWCDGDSLQRLPACPATLQTRLRDGQVLESFTAANGELDYALKAQSGVITRKKAKFDSAGIGIFTVGLGPNGRIYGSTALPLEMFHFDPVSRELRDLGNPTDVGGEIYSFATDGKLLYLCAYPNGFFSIFDPLKPWNYGKSKSHNPRGFGRFGDGHLRPRAMLMGEDGRVYVGSLPPYGQLGGAMGIYDPKKDAVVENYRHLITNQGIVSLCFDPVTKRIFGGSSIEAGGGGRPVEKEAVAFAWDPKTRHKDWARTVVAGDTRIIAMTAAAGKVFGVSRPSNTLFVLDARTCDLVHKQVISCGPVHEISLQYYPPHNRIYGLTRSAIFSVHPDTYAISEVAVSKEPITCGFAVCDSGIYFGSDVRLVRWRWD